MTHAVSEKTWWRVGGVRVDILERRNPGRWLVVFLTDLHQMQTILVCPEAFTESVRHLELEK